MRYSLSLIVFTIAIIWMTIHSNQCAQAAIVNTIHGSCEGRVIVRETTDRLVITILAADKRLFQFYARDVVSVTSTEKLLTGKATPLRPEPKEDVFPTLVFPRGVEVKILEDKPDLAWIKIQAGANLEGWIQRDSLTDQVIYSPEEQSIPLQKPSTTDPIPSQAASLSESATEPEQ